MYSSKKSNLLFLYGGEKKNIYVTVLYPCLNNVMCSHEIINYVFVPLFYIQDYFKQATLITFLKGECFLDQPAMTMGIRGK